MEQSSKIRSLASRRAARFSFLFFFILVSYHDAAVSADEIFTSTSGGAFGRSSREPKYKIEHHPVESPFYPDSGQEAVVMANKDEQSYTCFLPIVEEPRTMKSVMQQNSSSVIIEADRKIKLKTPDELMDVLKEQCLYMHEGWWSYEFCYQKHLRQLHLEDDKIVQEFVLGVFDHDATIAFNENHSDSSLLKDPRSKDASQRYHAHQYTNGTKCDLTDHPREAEVRFVCSEPTVIISSIKELSTCKYVVTVQCPLLCKHPMFQQERPAWHTIHCNKMPGVAKEPLVEEDAKGTHITIVADETGRFAT